MTTTIPTAHGGRLAVVISLSGEGGVERMVLNLVERFAQLQLPVDLVTIRADSEHLSDLPGNIRHVDLGVRHATWAAPALSRYLKRERPVAMLVAKDRAIRSAALARRLAGVPTRLVGRLGTNLSAALDGKSAVQRYARYLPMRWLYPWVDLIVAVSDGVAEDTRRITGLGAERLQVIRNPVITARLHELARRPAPHPWFDEPVPVIMGAGRLTRQKDFHTLLRAFAEVRAGRPCRLLILGEGGHRQSLEALARELGVAQDVALPGFDGNPYAYMARARLFVLSSAWEGSPNVLTEALACGTPVVATDCPSGPREILDGGRFGPLVPVGDVRAMAAAIAKTLEQPLPPEELRAAVAEYTVERSAERYLAALGLTC